MTVTIVVIIVRAGLAPYNGRHTTPWGLNFGDIWQYYHRVCCRREEVCLLSSVKRLSLGRQLV